MTYLPTDSASVYTISFIGLVYRAMIFQTIRTRNKTHTTRKVPVFKENNDWNARWKVNKLLIGCIHIWSIFPIPILTCGPISLVHVLCCVVIPLSCCCFFFRAVTYPVYFMLACIQSVHRCMQLWRFLAKKMSLLCMLFVQFLLLPDKQPGTNQIKMFLCKHKIYCRYVTAIYQCFSKHNLDNKVFILFSLQFIHISTCMWFRMLVAFSCHSCINSRKMYFNLYYVN